MDQDALDKLAAAANESVRMIEATALTVAEANRAFAEARDTIPEETRRELLAFFDSLVQPRVEGRLSVIRSLFRIAGRGGDDGH